jgi:hypothetical protein
VADDGRIGPRSRRTGRALGGGQASRGTFEIPKWRKPAPLGYGQALDTATSIAAPLLAGFAVSTAGVVSAATDRFRWPDVTLLLLACASIAMIAALQCGFHARQHLYSPSDVADWWPEQELTVTGRTERLQREQRLAFDDWARWAVRARLAYNAGIVVLAQGLAAMVAPPVRESGTAEVLRWIASVIVCLAGIIEAALMIDWKSWARS